MASTHESIGSCLRGKCMTMCPNTELRMRQREKLVHPLEMRLDTSGLPTKQANPQMMVKAFSRSAADKTINPADVRILPTLMKTCKYLLNNVSCRTDAPWSLIYQFVTDRLRAIRQDIVVQGISNSVSTTILQGVVRFHIYAHYRMCEHEVQDFDPFLNLKHIHETLKSVIVYYNQVEVEVNKSVNITKHRGISDKFNEDEAHIDSQEQDTDEESDESDSQSDEGKIVQDAETSEKKTKLNQEDCSSGVGVQNSHPIVNHIDTSSVLESRNKQRIESENERVWEEVNSEFSNLSLQNIGKGRKRSVVRTSNSQEEAEALYLLVFLGHGEALAHALTLPICIRCSEVVSLALEMSLAWQAHNYHRTIQLWQFLPPLLSAAAHIHLPTIQRYALGVMSTAYNSKVTSFPVEDLCSTLNFGSVDNLLEALTHYGLDSLTSEEPTLKDGQLTFKKSNFKWDVDMVPGRRSRWMEEQIESVSLSDFLIPTL